MQLRLKHPSERVPTLEAYFTVDSDYPSEVIADGQLMLTFLQYLQTQVSGPDLEVMIQMFGVWFSHPTHAGSVRIAPWNGQFHISYPIPDRWTGWDRASMVGATSNRVLATEMLFSAFTHQPPPRDWKDHLLYPNGILPERSEQEYQQLRFVLRQADQQTTETIQEYFVRLQAERLERVTRCAEQMLALLEAVVDSQSNIQVWGRTDDTILTLLQDSDAEGGLRIVPSPFGYTMSYPAPAQYRPWTDARIEQSTIIRAEAVNMIATALQRLRTAEI